MSSNADQPAFPMVGSHDDDHPEILTPQHFGLSKREYYAGLAMQGLLAGMTSKSQFHINDVNNQDYVHCVNLATEAIDCADALLSALNTK